jgi:hypothetical protein
MIYRDDNIKLTSLTYARTGLKDRVLVGVTGELGGSGALDSVVGFGG